MEQRQRVANDAAAPDEDCPLVTIVISSYNYEAYVIQAIRSALDQTYRNVEVVVVDDGSTDRSWQLIQDFAAEARDPRLKIFRKENEGASRTVNFGVARASGEFIALLAPDDYFHPEKVERQVALFRNSPPNVEMVHSGGYADYGEGRIVDMAGQYVPAEGRCFEEILALEATAIAPTIMFRRTTFLEVGGLDATTIAEDVDFYAALAARGYEFRHDPARLVYKRFKKGSLGGRADLCLDSHFRTLDKYRDRLDPARQREIEDKLYRRMGQAAAAEGMIGLSFHTYAKLARRTRSPLPFVDFLRKTGRHFVTRALPLSLRHALRQKRVRASASGRPPAHSRNRLEPRPR